MEVLRTQRVEWIVTKRGVPIARVAPIEPQKSLKFGSFKDTIVIKGDLLSPIDVEWDVNVD